MRESFTAPSAPTDDHLLNVTGCPSQKLAAMMCRTEARSSKSLRDGTNGVFSPLLERGSDIKHE